MCGRLVCSVQYIGANYLNLAPTNYNYIIFCLFKANLKYEPESLYFVEHNSCQAKVMSCHSAQQVIYLKRSRKINNFFGGICAINFNVFFSCGGVLLHTFGILFYFEFNYSLKSFEKSLSDLS